MRLVDRTERNRTRNPVPCLACLICGTEQKIWIFCGTRVFLRKRWNTVALEIIDQITLVNPCPDSRLTPPLLVSRLPCSVPLSIASLDRTSPRRLPRPNLSPSPPSPPTTGPLPIASLDRTSPRRLPPEHRKSLLCGGELMHNRCP